MSDRDIAIVGMSCRFPRAGDIHQFWANMVNGVDCIGNVPAYRWRNINRARFLADRDAQSHSPRGAFLDENILFEPRKFGIIPNTVRHGDPDQFMMVELIDEALRDAAVGVDAPVRARTDVIIGRGGYTSQKLSEIFMDAEFFDLVLELVDRRFPDLFGDGQRDAIHDYLRSTLSPSEADTISTAIPNIVAGLSANRLNLGGLSHVVDGACASSLLAVEQAVGRLRLGQCDLAAAGGLFLTHSPAMYSVFLRLGAVSGSGQIRPFDRRADGIMIGEGAGVVLLKRAEDALRDGDDVYAVIKGVGVSSDGRGHDVLAPSSAGQVNALQRAYEDARIDPATIGYLEAHGTGTIVGDEAELTSVGTFFGPAKSAIKTRAMGSVKSMIGHLMPAAGMASLIRTAMALSNKVLPPSLHCEQPHPRLDDLPFYVNTYTRPWIHDPRHPPRRAGINAFGFGGVNSHVVLEEVPEPSAQKRALRCRPIVNAAHRETELVAFSATTPQALDERLQRLEQFLDGEAATTASLASIASSLLPDVSSTDPLKLALICQDAEHLRRLLTTVRAGLARGAASFDDEAIYYAPDAAHHRGKVACIFPGQGFPGLIGNYPRHLLDLCLHYPIVREQFDFLEARDLDPEDAVPTSIIFGAPDHFSDAVKAQLQRRLAPPASEADAPGARDFRPDERYLATIAVTLANWASWMLMEKFEVPIDMITGQSQGEMAALCAAGVQDFRETVPAYWKLLNPNPLLAPNGRMAFAWISEEKLAPLLAEYPGVHLAICMSPEAVIFGGPRELLLSIVERLRKEQVFVHLLPYPPIHTPMLSHLREEILASLDTSELEMHPAKIAVYSSITTEPFPTDFDGIRETLMMNIDRPLRVWQTLRRLHADGARIFVQMGGGHMAAHLTEFLGTSQDITTAAVDVETRDPLTQLNHFCATLFARGVPLTLDPLYAHRRVERIDLDIQKMPAREPVLQLPLRIDWTPLEHPNVPQQRQASVPPAPVAVVPVNTGHTAAALAAPLTAPPDAHFESEAANHHEHLESSHETEQDFPTVATPAAYPLLGELLHYVAGVELVSNRRLDLNEDLFLLDHHFVNATEVKPIEQCMPIMPMTFSMELMAEAATCLVPHLKVIGYEPVRAIRWIALNSSFLDLHIEAQVKSVDEETGVHRVNVTIQCDGKVSASSCVLMAEEYRQDLHLELSAPAEEHPWPWTMDELYGLRHLFHGPRFHCVSHLDNYGNPSFTGELTLLPTDQLFASQPHPEFVTDPVVMDGLGQLVGCWCIASGWEALPVGVEKIEFYRSPPPPGTRVTVHVEVTEFDPDTRRVKCQIETGDGQGYVWVRATGWTDWLFRMPRRLKDFIRQPARHMVANEMQIPGATADAVCMIVPVADIKYADNEWISATLLDAEELAACNAIENKKQRLGVLASRFAVKDAVRSWLIRTQGAASSHPAALTIGHDEHGRPFVTNGGTLPMPWISLAHSDGCAAAVAAGSEVGIDLEPAARDAESILPQFATADEISMIRTLGQRQPGFSWPNRLWCAKESVGKILGIGLDGRPKDFQAIDADEAGNLLVLHQPTGQRCSVITCLIDEWVIALATRQAEWLQKA